MSEGEATIIGLDIGGTKTAIVEGTFDGRILHRLEFLTEAWRPFAETRSRLDRSIRGLCDSAQDSGRRVVAISVSVGGPLRIESGVLLNPPHLPGWHHLRLRDQLMEAFPALPVFVEHDGNAGALAEFYFGAGRGRPNLRHLVFLTCGTGLGAGLIVNGQLLRGATDTAGEVGHLRLAPDGPLGYGKAGSWEGFASGAGLIELAARLFPDRWSAGTSIRQLVEAVLAGDPAALAVAAEAGRWMGRGIAILLDTLNPELVVVGTLGVVLGESLLRSARETVAAEALPATVAACEIVPAGLGRSVGDVASLMAAITRHPQPPPIQG